MSNLLGQEEPKNSLLIPKVLFAGAILFLLGYFLYKGYTTSNSPIRFTVCEIESVYTDSKGIGKNIRYYVNGKEYNSTCFSDACVSRKIGQRYLLHYTEDDPQFYEIYLDVPVPEGVEAPPNGWSERPSFKKK